LLAALPACSSSSTALSIDITTGQETTALTDLGVKDLTITLTSPVDATFNISRTAAPTGTFDFGQIPNTEYISVAVSATNAANEKVMTGASLDGLLLSAVSGDISVFLQERLAWARPPGGFQCSHLNGVATVRENASFVLTSGTATGKNCDPTDIDVYDMFGLTGDQSAAMLGLVPTTMVSLLSSANSADPQVLAINATGGVFWDYDTLAQNTGCPPSAFSAWSSVSGGAAIADTDGSSGTWYVVGATRTTGDPTNVVLEVGADCTTSEIQLNTPRRGAAAAWVPNIGLVVAGGSPEPGSAGVEVLAPGQNGFTAAPFPPDATTGAAMIPYGTPSGVLLVGGMNEGVAQPPRQLNPTCDSTTSCNVTTHTSVPQLPALTQTAAYTIATGQGLIIGTDPSGMTRTFKLDMSGNAMNPFPIVEAPLREPRRGAISIPSPTGGIALLGGEHADGTPATSIELFQP
jgi:hypothetical protein